MARNRVQFQKGYSLVQFMDEYGTEDKCTQALFRWRCAHSSDSDHRFRCDADHRFHAFRSPVGAKRRGCPIMG